MLFRCLRSLGVLCVVFSAPASFLAVAGDPGYNADIRPILVEACFSCHGPDSASRKADLRLDDRESATASGAIVPGKPEDSELIRRILSSDPDEVMPPPEVKKTLTERQRRMLEDWIRGGAQYEQHWSYLAPSKSPVPDVPADLRGRVRNPVDAFVFSRLAGVGLRPAPEASREVLARRAALDITGLPPAPEMLRSFLADTAEGAYERYVDRLLALPEWGEHRGRYWLDYARYADTHGIHFDNYREMWAYRDWVIRAFNSNMPYDQFTIENLAGDLLPNPTLDQQIASGFNRCNMTTNEGGIIDEEYAVLYARDRTETVSTVWLGLTAGCATCHNHKFDPLSQREFYELSAYFNNTTQAVRDGNIKDTPPVIPVPLFEDRLRFQELPGLIEAARGAIRQRHEATLPEFTAWASAATAETAGLTVHSEALRLRLRGPAADGRGALLQLSAGEQELPLSTTAQWETTPQGPALSLQGAAFDVADVGDFDAGTSFTVAAWIKAPASDGYGAICAKMEAPPGYRGWDFWLQQRRVGMHLVGTWPDQAIKVLTRNQIPANEWVHAVVTWDGRRSASGVRIWINGRLQEVNIENDTLRDQPLRTAAAFRLGQRSAGEAVTASVRDLQIHSRLLSEDEVQVLAGVSQVAKILELPPVDRTPEHQQLLREFWHRSVDEESQRLQSMLQGLERELAEIRARGTIAHIMTERSEPPVAYVLTRGEYDKRGEQVSADTPEVLPPLPTDAPRNRLGLARWLVSPEHPLTARVTVNRYWQEIFGTGLVQTTGDLGVSGELPINQPLLDWLAVDFRESGWDVKRLVRLLVTSAAYRQSAAVSPEALERDPANRLLSRGPRFRMDAEMIRDNALAASGLLVRRIGGPSVKPYQPEGVWEAIAMNVSNTRSYQRDAGEGLYRRSLYTFVKRMAPPAAMDIFNAPNREYCVVRRERTNTPLQALAALNDEQLVEAARVLAERVFSESPEDDDARLSGIYELVLSRRPRGPELEVLHRSLAELRAWYAANPADSQKLLEAGERPPAAAIPAAELAAWTMLCNQLLNLDEVLNK
ncbi:MAG: hypothetical protein RLZZ436_3928 [Planctomycetota bacterium]|jgi:cytochrome c553